MVVKMIYCMIFKNINVLFNFIEIVLFVIVDVIYFLNYINEIK